MKTKTKSTIKRVFACVMAAVMLVGLVPGGATSVQAATTKAVDLDSLGSKGTVSYKTKTKSGTWWQMSHYRLVEPQKDETSVC